MEQRHIPPAGESMILHHQGDENCPCKPRRVPQYKQSSRSRYGQHQGYQVIRINWQHNPTVKEESNA